MKAIALRVSESTYTPSNGTPIPMVRIICEVDGVNDLVSINLSKTHVSGNYKMGCEVDIDFRPRYVTGGRLAWRPASCHFNG